MDELRARLKSEAASFGALFQFVGDFQGSRSFPGENGFSVQNFRFSVGGRLDRGVDYLLQSNFGSVLDARVGFALHPSITVDVGRFKAPYSREFLTGAGDLDFVIRSQSVRALAPGRLLGIAARGTIDEGVEYGVGWFNGGGDVEGNARGRFIGVARLAWFRDGVEVAVNYASNGDRLPVVAGADPGIQNLDGLLGMDVRVTQGLWLFSAELDRGIGQLGTPRDPWGGHAGIGYGIGARSQLVGKVDYLDTGIDRGQRTLVVTGLNYWPTGVTQLQVNVVAPVRGFRERPQLLIHLELLL